MLTDVFILGATGFVGSAAVDAALEAGVSGGAWGRTEAQAAALRRRGVQVVASPRIPATEVVIDLIQPNLPRRLTEEALLRAAGAPAVVPPPPVPALPSGGLAFLAGGPAHPPRGAASHPLPVRAR